MASFSQRISKISQAYLSADSLVLKRPPFKVAFFTSDNAEDIKRP